MSNKETLPLNVRIPVSVMHRVKAKLRDPVYDRTRYGAMSGLVTRLLMNWLEEGEEKTNPAKPQLDLSFLDKDISE